MIPILRSILLCCSSLIWAWLWHIYQFLKVESELISPCLLVSWSLGGLFDSISMLMWILCLSWFKCTAHDLRGVQKELLQNIIFSEAKTSQFYHLCQMKPIFCIDNNSFIWKYCCSLKDLVTRPLFVHLSL